MGKGILAILIGNILGGLSYIWQDIALDLGVPPGTMAFLRNLIAVLVLAAIMACSTGFRLRFSQGEWLRLGIIGVFGLGVPLGLGVVGIQMSTAANGSILILLEPICIILLSWIILKEHIRPIQWGGIVLGIIGGYAVVVGNPFDPEKFRSLLESEYLTGNLILALHGMMWAIYTPTMKPLATKYRAIDLTFAVMLISLIPLAPWSYSEISTITLDSNFYQGLLYVLCLALLVSLLATLLWNFALKHMQASMVAPFVFVQPIVGGLAGAILLGDKIESGAIYGGGLIMLAVLLVTRQGNDDKEIEVTTLSEGAP